MNQKQMTKWQNYLKNGRLIGKMDIVKVAKDLN